MSESRHGRKIAAREGPGDVNVSSNWKAILEESFGGYHTHDSAVHLFYRGEVSQF